MESSEQSYYNMKSLVLQIKKNSKGFGLSLIYRGLDKYEEKDTGIFVARVVPGGMSEKYGLRENDRVVSINNIRPKTVEEAVRIIKDAGKNIEVLVERKEKKRQEAPQHFTFNQPQHSRAGESDQRIKRGTVVNPGPQRMTERNLREFDKMTRREERERPVERPLSPGVSSVKSSRSLHELGLENYPYPEIPTTAKLTRSQERQSLQNLNNRLAGYIDKVRSLEQDNSKLSKEIRKWETHQNQEITNIKYVYDQEIDSLKEVLDGLSKQYNQLRVASEGLLYENREMKENIHKKETGLDNTKQLVDELHSEIRDLSNKLRSLEADKRNTEMKLNETLPELYDIRKKLDQTKKALDEENFQKANLEDQLKRMTEENRFKVNVLENQLEEVKSRKEVEITEIDTKLGREYEDKLQKALHDLRDVYDKQMDSNKAELSEMYDARIHNLESELASERSRSSLSSNTLDETRARTEILMSRISELETVNLALQQKLSDLIQRLDNETFSHRAQLGAKDVEIEKLLEEVRRQQREYQTLMDTKVALDMEIAVYRRLLESEETRLGLLVDGEDGLVTKINPVTRTENFGHSSMNSRHFTEL